MINATNQQPFQAPNVQGGDSYAQLMDYLQKAGLMNQQGTVNQQAYYGMLRPDGAVQQQDVPWLVELNSLLTDRFANKKTGDERDALREQMAKKQLDYLQNFDSTPQGFAYDQGGRPTFNPSVDAQQAVFQSQLGKGGFLTGYTGGSQTPSAAPQWTPQTQQSTPFADAYIRAQAASQAQGPASRLFSDYLK